jgi:hypothetical protein
MYRLFDGDFVEELLKNVFVMAERANVGDEIVIRRESEVGGIDAGWIVEDVRDGAVNVFGNVVDVGEARNDAGDVDGIRSHEVLHCCHPLIPWVPIIVHRFIRRNS